MIKFLKGVLVHGWPYLLYIALIIFSLRDVLALPGTLGHNNWDWDISAFAAQIWGRLTHDFFVWDYQIRGGYYSPVRSGALYSFLALPLSIFGGEVFTKTVSVLLMLVSAVSMRQFTRGVLRLNSWWSTVAGALYMFSPVVYSRILAGHNILLPYAVFPLLLLYLFRTMQGCVEGRVPLREAVAAGVLLGLQGIHSSMMVLAFVVVGLVIFFALLRTRHRVVTLLSAAIIFAIFTLLNIYWALPTSSGYFSSGTLYHSGSFTDIPDQVNATAVISRREDLLQSTSQSMQESLREHATWGYDTEFDYPVPNALSSLWLLASCLLPFAAFGILLSRTGSKDSYLVLALSGLIGATLVSGANVLTGGVIYQWLMLHAFPIWAEFGNAVRALPLVALAYSALVPALLQQCVERLQGRAKYAVTALVVLVILVYVSPFLSGTTLVNPGDSLSLKSYQPSAADQSLYNYLRNDQEDYRITYVPPPWIYYPENYDLGYAWIGGLSPHPEFFVPYYDPQVWVNASDFRSDMQESISGKLLGLGAVKYVIYPRARFINPSLGLSPLQPSQDNSARARFVDQVLATQKNLTPVAVPLTGTIVLRNDAYLPRIYAASQSTLVEGSSDALPAFADSSFFNQQPAIFFSAQQSPQDLPRLTSQTDRAVDVGSQSLEGQADVAGANPALLFHSSPPTEPVASFSVPRGQSYVIRVQAAPFQFCAPHSDDVLTATFDKLKNSQDANWSSNLPYNYSLAADSNSLQVTAYLDKSSAKNGYVQMDQIVKSMNLADYPVLRIASQVENPAIQAVAVQLSLDLDGDGVVDATWSSPVFTHANFKTDELNVLPLVRQEFPDKPYYQVVGIGVRFQMKPQADWEKVDYPARLYTYGLRELGFYQQSSETAKSGWVWQLPKDLAVENVVSLSRSLDDLDAQRFPVLVEYQSDGPATLYAEMQLTVKNQDGLTTTIPTGAQLLEPFSSGTLTLDVRDQLLQSSEAQNWTAAKVAFTVHRLEQSQELRPTVFTLGRAGAQWLPGSTNLTKPQPPTLTVDGERVTLQEIPADADHLRYTTEDLTLSEGKHKVSATYSDPNSRYAVESIEVEPVAPQPKPSVPPTISFESVDPTRYRVHVTNAQSPFFLVFSENFHENWTAYIEPATSSQPSNSQFAFFNPSRWYELSALLSLLFDGGHRDQVPDHYLVNGYANSWRVDKTGSYDIVIEFSPQRLYEGGLIVSIATFLACLLFLSVSWFKHRRAR